jgi:hypothetical protein
MPVHPNAQHFLDMLPTRTKASLRTLHYSNQGDVYRCLDLNLTAATLRDLNVAALDALNAMAWEDVLPSAPVSDWVNILGMKMRNHYVLRFRCANGALLGCAYHEGRL